MMIMASVFGGSKDSVGAVLAVIGNPEKAKQTLDELIAQEQKALTAIANLQKLKTVLDAQSEQQRVRDKELGERENTLASSLKKLADLEQQKADLARRESELKIAKQSHAADVQQHSEIVRRVTQQHIAENDALTARDNVLKQRGRELENDRTRVLAKERDLDQRLAAIQAVATGKK